MVSKVEQQPKLKNDNLLWPVIAILLGAVFAGNYYFSKESLLLRVIVILVTVAFSLFLASKTEKGKLFMNFWQNSLVELRKVYWPTKKETVNTTLAVLGFVFVMGIILWIMDSILIKLMAWVLGTR